MVVILKYNKDKRIQGLYVCEMIMRFDKNYTNYTVINCCILL